MMTIVWLARHGETLWAVEDKFNGLADTDLTERGRAQARGLAARLRGRPLAAVYCSPLRRTIETATIAAEPHGLAPQPVEALHEIALYMRHEGRPPTGRDLATALGVTMRTGAHCHVEALEARGLIDTGRPGQARAIRITDAGLGLLGIRCPYCEEVGHG